MTDSEWLRESSRLDAEDDVPESSRRYDFIADKLERLETELLFYKADREAMETIRANGLGLIAVCFADTGTKWGAPNGERSVLDWYSDPADAIRAAVDEGKETK